MGEKSTKKVSSYTPTCHILSTWLLLPTDSSQIDVARNRHRGWLAHGGGRQHGADCGLARTRCWCIIWFAHCWALLAVAGYCAIARQRPSVKIKCGYYTPLTLNTKIAQPKHQLVWDRSIAFFHIHREIDPKIRQHPSLKTMYTNRSLLQKILISLLILYY